jgi:hypothetical protein
VVKTFSRLGIKYEAGERTEFDLYRISRVIMGE